MKPHQLLLPGIPERPSAAEIKAHVAARLEGFELRQQERARLRAERREKPRRIANVETEQPLLFPE